MFVYSCEYAKHNLFLLFINYCVIFHTNNCIPTFAPPCINFCNPWVQNISPSIFKIHRNEWYFLLLYLGRFYYLCYVVFIKIVWNIFFFFSDLKQFNSIGALVWYRIHWKSSGPSACLLVSSLTLSRVAEFLGTFLAQDL